VSGCRFLDVYAGTGAVGIEALSRGAASATFVEANPKTAQLLKKNLAACQLTERAVVRTTAAETFFQRSDWWEGPYDLVFADPPYADADALEAFEDACNLGLLSADGVLVIERLAKASLPTAFARTQLVKRYVYGDTALFVYRSASEGARST
ncbi:MAG TPA: RsmD family RNA methyltransferase, partial [Nitrospira sp.]|nr:RsmD family RNA methyltransferase [Nitrospira sp.]